MIKLTYRGFCVLLTVSTGPQCQKWHTRTTKGIALRNSFYYFKTVSSLSVLSHNEGPFNGPSSYTFRVYREESNKLSKLLKKSRRKYDKQLAFKAKTQPKLFFTHVRWNRHLKKNIIGFKDNEGETIFTSCA